MTHGCRQRRVSGDAVRGCVLAAAGVSPDRPRLWPPAPRSCNADTPARVALRAESGAPEAELLRNASDESRRSLSPHGSPHREPRNVFSASE
eukprot:3374647-Alexandrium_andersonii.AAC.1